MKTLSLLFILLIPNFSRAYSDLYGEIGYAAVDSPFRDRIDLLQTGVGGTFGLGSFIFLGANIEYSALSHISSQSKNLKLYKNQKYLTIKPIIGFSIYSYTLKFSYSELGYTALKQEKNQDVAKSTKASGLSITLLKRVVGNWAIGSNYSIEKFEEVETTRIDANQSARMVAASVVVAFMF